MAIVINPISPVAFSVFGLDIRWYALAYIAGFVGGYWLFKYLTRKSDSIIKLSKQQIDDLLTAIVFGVIIGGRLGYVLFYNLGYFLSHPLEILAVWHGGMSFHGGLLGVIIAIFLFAYKQKQNPWALLDLMAVVTPIGLFLAVLQTLLTKKSWAVPQMYHGLLFLMATPPYHVIPAHCTKPPVKEYYFS
jgi:phosphatidylglycerol:prolipoprotein diacylglycerol transferase